MAFSSDWGRLTADLQKAATLDHAVEQSGVLRAAADRGVEIAQEKLGTYQADWPELAESTQRERERAGFPPNEPLLRTGDLRAAIRVLEDTGSEVIFGIAEDDEHYEQGLTQEHGSVSHNVPPRPFIGPTAEELAPELPAGITVVVRNVFE